MIRIKKVLEKLLIKFISLGKSISGKLWMLTNLVIARLSKVNYLWLSHQISQYFINLLKVSNKLLTNLWWLLVNNPVIIKKIVWHLIQPITCLLYYLYTKDINKTSILFIMFMLGDLIYQIWNENNIKNIKINILVNTATILLVLLGFITNDVILGLKIRITSTIMVLLLASVLTPLFSSKPLVYHILLPIWPKLDSSVSKYCQEELAFIHLSSTSYVLLIWYLNLWIIINYSDRIWLTFKLVVLPIISILGLGIIGYIFFTINQSKNK